MQKESNDPTQFQVSLLLNNEPASVFAPFNLDFIAENQVTFRSSDFKTLKLQTGYVKIVLGLVTAN